MKKSVSDFKVGEAVFGLVHDGAYAEVNTSIKKNIFLRY